MLTAEAHVQTTRASRYLIQFCKHADSMSRHGGHGMHLGEALTRRDVQVRADWSDTRGVVTFSPWGQCTVTADEVSLTFRVEANGEENLQQIQDVITRDLDRFARRDGLTVTWQPASPALWVLPRHPRPAQAHTCLNVLALGRSRNCTWRPARSRNIASAGDSNVIVPCW
jgi:hypothetical protein